MAVSAAVEDLGPKLNVGGATLRRKVMRARAGTSGMPRATTGQLAEMARLKKKNAGLR